MNTLFTRLIPPRKNHSPTFNNTLAHVGRHSRLMLLGSFDLGCLVWSRIGPHSILQLYMYASLSLSIYLYKYRCRYRYRCDMDMYICLSMHVYIYVYIYIYVGTLPTIPGQAEATRLRDK